MQGRVECGEWKGWVGGGMREAKGGGVTKAPDSKRE